MNKIFCILVIVCCVSVFGFYVFAELSVGLNQGDWVEYKVTYTGSPPENYPEKLRVEVQTIQGTNITLEIKRDLLNGTQDVKTATFNLENGAYDLIVIPANLGAGDKVYHDDLGDFTLEEVADYSFKGTTIEIVYATVVRTEFSWDRSTGVLIEAEHSRDTFTQTLRAVDTNIVLARASDIDPILLYAIIIAVIAILVVAAFFLRRKKPLEARLQPKTDS